MVPGRAHAPSSSPPSRGWGWGWEWGPVGQVLAESGRRRASPILTLVARPRVTLVHIGGNVNLASPGTTASDNGVRAWVLLPGRLEDKAQTSVHLSG